MLGMATVAMLLLEAFWQGPIWSWNVAKSLPQAHWSGPVAGRISSPFGRRADPLLGVARHHGGIDIAAQFGTPVYAAAPGRVVFVGWKGGYGQMVAVDHGHGWTSRYAHLASAEVQLAEDIDTQTRLGLVGQSGRSTGPHLHFELHYGPEAIDPLPFFAMGHNK